MEQRIQVSSMTSQYWVSIQIRQSIIVHLSLVSKTQTQIQSSTVKREIRAFWPRIGVKTQTQSFENHPKFLLTTRKTQQINYLHHCSNKQWNKRNKKSIRRNKRQVECRHKLEWTRRHLQMQSNQQITLFEESKRINWFSRFQVVRIITS